MHFIITVKCYIENGMMWWYAMVWLSDDCLSAYLNAKHNGLVNVHVGKHDDNNICTMIISYVCACVECAYLRYAR